MCTKNHININIPLIYVVCLHSIPNHFYNHDVNIIHLKIRVVHKTYRYTFTYYRDVLTNDNTYQLYNTIDNTY